MKKTLKRMFSIVITLAMTFNIFAPLTVLAEGETDTINVTINSSGSRVTLGVQHPQSGNDELIATVDGHNNIMGFRSTSNSQENLKSVTITCTENGDDPIIQCTAVITVSQGTGVELPIAGDAPFEYVTDIQNITGTVTLNIRDRQLASPFDGTAILLWDCGGKLCGHKFDDIRTDQTNYITAENAVDQIATSNQKTFDVNAKLIGVATTSSLANWESAYKEFKNIPENEEIDWSTVDPQDIIGDPIDMREWEDKAVKAGACSPDNVTEDQFHACVDTYTAEHSNVFATRAQLQPVGEPQQKNAYVSYGDRQFKLIVYNENFRGLSIGSLADLDYYPASWADPLTRQETWDISETTKENPAEIVSIILEKSVNISATLDNLHIKSIEALDVPANAVDIKNVDNGAMFKLTFSSNFYNKVVFKVTDTEGKTYFVRIKRLAVDAWIAHDRDAYNVRADLYFDNRTSYKDYKITAKLVYKDGTSKIVELVNQKKIDDGLGNITYDYEANQEAEPSEQIPFPGKGLKIASYGYEISESEIKKISKVYVNVEKAGSTTTNYAGSYVGAGKGEELVVSDFVRE